MVLFVPVFLIFDEEFSLLRNRTWYGRTGMAGQPDNCAHSVPRCGFLVSNATLHRSDDEASYGVAGEKHSSRGRGADRRGNGRFTQVPVSLPYLRPKRTARW